MNPEQSNHSGGFDSLVGCVVTRGYLYLGILDEFSGTQLRRVFPLVIQSMFNEKLQTTPPNASGKKRRIRDLLTEKKMNISDLTHTRTGHAVKSLPARPCEIRLFLSWLIIFPRYLIVNIFFV